MTATENGGRIDALKAPAPPHQDRTLTELSDAVAEQWKRIDALTREVLRMRDEVKGLNQRNSPTSRRRTIEPRRLIARRQMTLGNRATIFSPKIYFPAPSWTGSFHRFTQGLLMSDAASPVLADTPIAALRRQIYGKGNVVRADLEQALEVQAETRRSMRNSRSMRNVDSELTWPDLVAHQMSASSGFVPSSPSGFRRPFFLPR